MNKKHLLVFSGILSFVAVNAQTTITAADQPQILQVYHQATDTTQTQNPGNSGASQTYGLSGLLNQQEDSMTFTAPQWTPYDTSYPAANLCMIMNQGDMYIYGDMQPTQFEIHGQAFDPLGNGVIPLIFTNPETQMIFPAAYGDSFVDTAGGVNQFYMGYDPGIGFTVDSVRIHSLVTKNSEYDGWGSLQSPMGTFNVLRQNTFRKQIDTIDIYAFGNWAPAFFSQEDSVRTYSYWTNGIGFPVVELTDQDDLGQITRATWLVMNPTVTGVAEHSSDNMIVYPNPAATVVTFETPSAQGSIEITDVTGRVVKTVQITSAQTQVDVSDLASGLYTYNVNGTAKGKIEVAH